MWPVNRLILTYSGLGFRVSSSCFLSVSSAPLSFRTRVSLRFPPDLVNWYTGKPLVGVRLTVYGSEARRMLDEAGLGVGDAGDGCIYLLVREIVRVTGPLETGSKSAVGVVCAGAAVARQRRAGVRAESRVGQISGRAMQLNRNSDIIGCVLCVLDRWIIDECN